MATLSPRTRIVPESGGWAPESTFMRVDLPAPFPPTRPTTSPSWRSMLTPSTACTPPNETRMSCIATIGGWGWSASGARSASVLVTIAPPPISRRSTPQERVETHGGDEDDSDDDVLRRRVDAQQQHAGAQRLHHDGPQDGPRDGADTTGEGRATDDGGRDDVELVLHAEPGHRGVKARGLHGGADRAQDPHEREGQHHRAPRIDAREGRRRRRDQYRLKTIATHATMPTIQLGHSPSEPVGPPPRRRNVPSSGEMVR